MPSSPFVRSFSMSSQAWLDVFRTRAKRRRSRPFSSARRGARFALDKRRLGLETLEDRALLAAAAVSALADRPMLQADRDAYDPSKILVRFRQEAAVERGAGILTGAQLGAPIDLVPGLRTVNLPENVSVNAALQAFRASPLVLYAEPNYRWSVADHVAPDDPDFPALYGLHNTGQTGGTADADVDAPEAWNINTGSASVLVGVIDTGVDYNHQDLAANIWTNPGEIPNNQIDDDENGWVDDIHGINAITNTGDPMDDHGHGTHVSGTIGATPFNEGVVGVNWRVSIIGLKFLDASGSGYTSDAIKCFEYLNFLKNVQGHNVVASNNSWGGGEFSQALQDVIAGLDQPGMDPILHVFAAGNAGSNNDAAPFYPANYALPNKLVVAATDHNDHYAYFSSYGATTVDLAAPGVSILSTLPYNSYTWWDGTSMATPHVTGAAALVAATFPDSSAEYIKQRILAGVDPIGALGSNAQKPTATNGRLNIANALSGRAPDPDETPPAAVDDLAVANSALFSIALTRSASGDDGDTGTASFYDVRYGASPILSESDWNAATKAIGEPDPRPSGSTETFVVTGLDHSTSYHFAVRTRDNLGHLAALSNIVLGETQSATVVYEDDMESGALGWDAWGLWHLAGWRASSPVSAFYYGDEYSCYSYPNSGALTSPAIDLSGLSEAFLTFQEWRQVESFEPYDGAYLFASSDGVNWQTVWQSYSSTNAWVQQTVDLTPWAGGEVYLQFYFETIDEYSNYYEGWYVDDVAVLAPGSATPGLYVQDASIAEGDSGAVTATFKVKRVGSDGVATVQWSTSDGSATAASDYYQPVVSDTLSFAIGETEKTITVQVNGDHKDEANETFFVNLLSAVGAEIADGQGRGTIVDDDTAGISLDAPSGLVTSEGGGSRTLSVALTSQPSADVIVTLASSDTTEGNVSPTQLTFASANWSTPQWVTLTGVNDQLDDGDITYWVSATAASADGGYQGLSASLAATNLDNDFSVTYTGSNVPKKIPDGGSVTSTLTAAAHIILDINVQLSITHTRDEDVEVYLTAPGVPQPVELFTDVGGAGKNFTNTILDDEAATPITSGAAPFSNSYRPEGKLSDFDGKNSQGNWVLSVTDDKKGQKGTLNQWSITILYEQSSGKLAGGANSVISESQPATIGSPDMLSGAKTRNSNDYRGAPTAYDTGLVDQVFGATSNKTHNVASARQDAHVRWTETASGRRGIQALPQDLSKLIDATFALEGHEVPWTTTDANDELLDLLPSDAASVP
jgi:subtilisin family serine protease/subtilisin-like proprotein convertase family protein